MILFYFLWGWGFFINGMRLNFVLNLDNVNILYLGN